MGYDRCFLPAVDELRNRAKAGHLGRIIQAEGDWKSIDANSQPGSLADHMLYTMIELVGPVDSFFVQAAHLAARVDTSETV